MAYGLDGCLAKIERAKEHHESLKTYVAEFLKSANECLKQSSYHSDDGLKVILRATCPLEPDLKIAVIAGEIVHQLRSSLDHLLCALIKQNGNTRSKQSQFPICTTRENYDNEVRRGRIKGVSLTAEKLIEQFQPYNNKDPNTTTICVTSNLNNWDKHNALVISAAAAQVGENIEIDGGTKEVPAQITNFSMPETIKLENGKADYFYIQLAAPAPGVIVKSSIKLHMAIEIDEKGTLAPLIDVMEEIIASTEGTIRLFREEFK